MNVSIDDTDRNPEIIIHEENLIGVVPAGINGDPYHAFLCLQCGGWHIVGEIGLRGMWFAEIFHALQGCFVLDELKIKRVCDRLIGDIVVSRSLV